MHKGYLCLVLHGHLPFVRHPEHEYFLEENWLYEAITETYIPLILVSIIALFILSVRYKHQIYSFFHPRLVGFSIRKIHILFLVILLLILFIIYNNVGLEKFPGASIPRGNSSSDT